jgi:hypothetical protein
MAKQTVEFPVAIGEKVKILANGVIGEIKGLYCDPDGVRWANVQYATTSGEVIEEWFRMTELNYGQIV